MWGWFVKGGVVMYPLLLCSILALATILERLWSFRLLLKEGRALYAADSQPKEWERASSVLVRRLQTGLPVLETIVTVAPMLGLLGTILGVIESFEILSGNAAALDKANLSGGLAEALITTAAGLIIAIPALIAHNVFRRRIDVFIDWCNERLSRESGDEPC